MIKMRVRIGIVEVEYEGPEEFLRSDLPELLKATSVLAKSGASISSERLLAQEVGGDHTQPLEGTTANIAGKLGVKSGSELVIAAAAHLALVKSQKTFSRKAVLAEMKTASAYYKQTYSNNLSRYITALIKEDKLNEPAGGQLALTPSAEADLRLKLKGPVSA